MEKAYILTERAHLMCPNMQFGFICTINDSYDFDKVKAVLGKLCQAHPTLCACISNDEDGRPYYDVQAKVEPVCEKRVISDSLLDDYRAILLSTWNAYRECLLKLYIYPGEHDFQVLFVAHHILCDGRGLLLLAQEFADCYVKGMEPVYMEEAFITSILDLPTGSNLPWISKMVVNSANKQWKKEGQTVSYEQYLSFEKDYLSRNQHTIRVETLTGEPYQRLLDLCRQNQISVNDYLVAKLMKEEAVHKVVIAADIRKYLTDSRVHCIGNYSTAFGVACKSQPNDLLELARIVSKEIREHLSKPRKLMLVLACYLNMIPELIDAVPIATMGDYASKAGLFVGSNMFGYQKRNGYSITNLGKLCSDTIAKATFFPPASPANRMTVGVITVNDVLNTCVIV